MTAFEILTQKHDYIQKNGENPSEYNEDKIIEAMEEYAQQQVKNFNIPAVMQRSEQLVAFVEWLEKNSDHSIDRDWIDEYIKATNCA